MAITLQVPLTNAQQAVMVDIANLALEPGSTNAEKLAWAVEVASDGLRAEVERLGIYEVDHDARDAQNVARRAVIERVAAAWPDDG